MQRVKRVLRACALALGGLLLAILLLAVLAALWFLPSWQLAPAREQLVAIATAQPTELSTKDRLALEKDLTQAEWSARGTIVQGLGGIVLLVGVFFAWRNLQVAQRNQAAAVEGQITERFTRAVDQLASTNSSGEPQLETRLGGIYALERIARDSARDHVTVMEILTAYVREHAQEDDEAPKREKPRADVQAALTVIGRRDPSRDGPDSIDLSHTLLRGADLREARLSHAYLIGIHLEKASLGWANLESAILHDAHLEGAFGSEVVLTDARMVDAHLEDAHLVGAHLERALLAATDFTRANLAEAHLEGTILRQAIGLTQEQIRSAFTDAKTQLPSYLVQAGEP